MATFLIILFILTLFHFIYDSIILPSLRIEYKYKLYSLRDRLRELKSENHSDINDDVFFYLNDSINVTIAHLPSLTLSTFLKVKKELKHNHQLDKQIKQRIELINNCKVTKIKDISEELFKNTTKVFFINMGIMVIYLVPFIIAAIILAVCIRAIILLYANFKKDIQKITFIPGNYSNIFPESEKHILTFLPHKNN